MRERIHFIGVGGISMSTLAAIAVSRGAIVSGSDRSENDLTERLKKLGVRFFPEHRAENVAGAERVVYTAAIPDDNPEMCEARRLGIPLLRRSEYLGEIMRSYPVRIGVSGTHGKSSTTGMLAQIFLHAGLDPTVACGAVLSPSNSAYILGNGEHFIYEACEYKDSFLDFFPSVCVILNIEMDHVDYFHSIEQMRASYLRSTEHAGAVIANWNDENVRQVCSKIGGAWIVRAGVECPEADYVARDVTFENGCGSFDLCHESEVLGRVRLPIPGRHHVHNAVCAAAAAHVCGVEPSVIIEALSGYQSVKRRFEHIGDYRGASVYDDYAHHPTEIEATLRAARAVLPEGARIVCVFQPHTFSRTSGFLERFISSLSLTDKLFLLPIYAAREQNTVGVSSEQIASHIDGARACKNAEEAAEAVRQTLRPGDMLLTMGAGKANVVGQMLLKEEGDAPSERTSKQD